MDCGFVRLVAGARGPSVPLPPVLYPDWALTDLFFFTEARGELERRAGGPYVQTIGHEYVLSAAELAYLAALGFDAIPALSAMNAAQEIAPDPSARNYVRQYASFTGKIKSPVLSIHTTWDTLVPVSHEQRYAATVDAAGRSATLHHFQEGLSAGTAGSQMIPFVPPTGPAQELTLADLPPADRDDPHGYAALIAEFVACARANRPPTTSATVRDGRLATAAVLASFDSIRTGQPVTIAE